MAERILVIGGGQLGWMLALEAQTCGLEVDRFDFASSELILSDSIGPDAQRQKIKDSRELLDRYPLITAELEHLPLTPIVAELVNSQQWLNRAAFDVLPDRYTQKKLLDQLGVATAPWRLIENAEQLVSCQAALGDLVVKTTRGGYDGRGQWRCYAPASGAESDTIPTEVFGQIIAEARIPFQSEVSLIGARQANGECFFYPLTTNVHEQGILRYSLFMTENRTLKLLQRDAESALTKVMNHLKYVGVMAMECFLINGVLMVNELAPRVHNSGHWTQLGARQSQFAAHLRAIAGLPFNNHGHYQSSVMLNLIGCEYNPHWAELEHVQCYWYQKEVRPVRKLGHLNIALISPQQFSVTVDALLPTLDKDHCVALLRAQSDYGKTLQLSKV